MKKHLSVALTLLLAASLLCGCTANDNSDTSAAPDAGATATPGNTPNTSPDTPNDSIIDDMGDAVGDAADNIGDAARRMNDDISGSARRDTAAGPDAGADRGVTTKR